MASNWLSASERGPVLGRLRDLYSAEVTMTDRWLGRYMERFHELELHENTVVVPGGWDETVALEVDVDAVDAQPRQVHAHGRLGYHEDQRTCRGAGRLRQHDRERGRSGLACHAERTAVAVDDDGVVGDR